MEELEAAREAWVRLFANTFGKVWTKFEYNQMRWRSCAACLLITGAPLWLLQTRFLVLGLLTPPSDDWMGMLREDVLRRGEDACIKEWLSWERYEDPVPPADSRNFLRMAIGGWAWPR